MERRLGAFAARVAFAACIAFAGGCAVHANFAEPQYGSECVIDVDPIKSGPHFTLLVEHDMGGSPDSSRLTLDIVTWQDALNIAGLYAAAKTKYQLVVHDPFGVGKRLVLRDTYTGQEQAVTDPTKYEAYSAPTNPVYGGAVVVDDANIPEAKWVNVVVGHGGADGFRFLVENA